jgi:regulatory protein
VRRTLERRTSSWARRALRAGAEPEAVARDASAAREHIGPVVARLCEVGLVDDASFAQARARRMASGGRSRRAIAAHLAQKGVAPDAAREAVVAHDGDAELDAAIAFARKRRVGPFAREAPPPGREERRAAEQKTLGAMARAGFDFATCERVLRMDRDDAEERLRDRRDF